MINIFDGEQKSDIKLRINESEKNQENGFWKYVASEYLPEGFYLKCSNCGFDTGREDISRICPNCKAMMRY